MTAFVAESAIDWDALLEVLWASFLGGVGVTAVFGIAILGATRTVELRRDGRDFAAGAYGVLTAIASGVVVAAVVFGVVVMTSKG